MSTMTMTQRQATDIMSQIRSHIEYLIPTCFSVLRLKLKKLKQLLKRFIDCSEGLWTYSFGPPVYSWDRSTPSTINVDMPSSVGIVRYFQHNLATCCS